MTMNVPLYAWTSVGMVLLVLAVAGLSKAAQVAPRTSPEKVAKQLIESAAQKLKAADQDSKALQKLADSQFGMAYVNAARMLSTSDAALAASTGVHVNDLHASLRTHQQEAYDAICIQYPSLKL
jgi:hypothetical protein